MSDFSRYSGEYPRIGVGMRFASYWQMARRRMSRFLCLLMGIFTMGCLTTEKIDFIPEENFPPSIVSAPGAEHPLNEIGALDLDAPIPPGGTTDYVLETVIRDVNVEDTLQYRLFRDAVDASSSPILSGEIPPEQNQTTGQLLTERPFDRPIPFTLMGAPGVCHRFELLVTTEFKNFVEPREPVLEGDLDTATWWVRVTDDDNAFILQECQ